MSNKKTAGKASVVALFGTIALSSILLVNSLSSVFGSLSSYTASTFAQYCASNSNTCVKVDTSNRGDSATAACPLNGQTISRVFGHVGNVGDGGNAVYESPDANFSISSGGVGSSSVTISKVNHGISWVGIFCTTPTASPTATATATGSPTASPTASPSPTATATAKATVSPSSSPTATPTETPVVTPTPSATPTGTPTGSATPTATPNLDVCPNIAGIQTSLPDGYHFDNNGINCLQFELGGPPQDGGIGGGQVLGTSTGQVLGLASTGSFAGNFYLVMTALGALITFKGFANFRKVFKKA
jgi:cell division septation protein DedD